MFFFVSEPVGSKFKLKVSLDGFNFRDCTNIYGRRGYHLIANGQLCAGGEAGVGACAGDAGNCVFYFVFGFVGITVYLL